MQLNEITSKLYDFLNRSKAVFLTWDPTSFDSTTLAKLQIKLKFQNSKQEFVGFTVNAGNSVVLTNILEKVNDVTKTVFIGHDFKNLFTLFRRLNKKPLCLTNIFDLHWYESYLGLQTSKNDITAQMRHIKDWLANQTLSSLYKQIYRPLIVEVLPDIESVGLVNQDLGTLVFPNFVVEGQTNGRLSCICEYKRCYNPHSLSDEEKECLTLFENDGIFLWYDYNNMEVSVLAELADDPVLKEIIQNHPKHVYEKIFEKITGVQNENARKMAKSMFLPCIYGQGPNGLAKTLNISQEQAAIYLHKMTDAFPKSFAYVEGIQRDAKEKGTVNDRLGRIRHFTDETYFKARNFAVQSPSALLCLESLVNLHKSTDNKFRIIFTVHDGYCIAATKSNVEHAYKTARSVLQQQSSILPINFNVSIKIGRNLAKMVPIGQR